MATRNGLSDGPPPARGLAARSAVCSATFLAIALLFAGVLYAADVLLLLFTGLLFAVLLRGIIDWVHDVTRLPRGWALALTCILLVGTVAGTAWVFTPRVAAQFDALGESIPQAIDTAVAYLKQFELGRWLLDAMPDANDVMPRRADIFSRMTGVVSGTIAAIGAIAVVAVVALYLAADPRPYRRGMLALIPPARRDRAREVLDQVELALRRWFLAKLVAMAVVGVFIWAGLTLLGMELALALALVAGLLTFIPNFGPILAATPALLLGLLDGPMMMAWVAVLYITIQTVESYIITPLIQRKALSIPPGLIIGAQLVMGVFTGILGLALATPLLAATIVLVRELYVHDVLKDETTAGRPSDP